DLIAREPTAVRRERGLQGAPEHRVGLAAAIHIGGDHSGDRRVGGDRGEVAVVVEGHAEPHESTSAPGADGGPGRVFSALLHRAQSYGLVAGRPADTGAT